MLNRTREMEFHAGRFRKKTLRATAVLAVLALCAPAARAVRIGDVTHLKGQRINHLTGMGLVVGLNGSGDGGKYLPAIRPLAAMLTQFANPVLSTDELKSAKNVALVAVEANLPEYGAREGDRIDVKVTSIGAAKSLVGGRLLITPLQGPHKADMRIYALASGPLHVPDTVTPTAAVITRGATLEADVIYHYVVDNQITLVLDDAHAGWGMAYAVAQMIIEETSEPGKVSGIAKAVDPKNVIVTIPPVDRASPAGFIARLEGLDLLLPQTEARINVNRRTGTIVVTGDVEISPVAISHKGLTINTTAQPVAPVSTAGQEGFLAMDPGKRGGAKMADLIDALNQLKVPVDDRITIIEELYKTGKLHARLIVEE
jgi:flagellar P-ring protein precursor FlgI